MQVCAHVQVQAQAHGGVPFHLLGVQPLDPMMHLQAAAVMAQMVGVPPEAEKES